MIAMSLAIISLVAAIDLGIKWWVEKNVPFKKDKKLLGGHGILRKVHNKGMMMGLCERRTDIVKVLSAMALTVIVLVQALILGKPDYLKENIGMSLVTGGAISNTVDRFKRGYVVDYFAFNSKNKKISKVTYNIGDFAIFAGAILIVFSSILKSE